MQRDSVAAQTGGGSPGRMAELDGLRAIAILLVLAFHATVSLPFTPVRTILGFGWVGVDLFFVISGFLIGGILLDQRQAANYYRVFYLRRFFRIVPLYALVLAPALLVIGLGLAGHFQGRSLGESGAAIWLYPFFLQNFGAAFLLVAPKYLAPAWSLAVEEQFYLLMPPLVRRLSSRRLLLVIMAGILTAPLLRAGLFLWFGTNASAANYVLLPTRWDALLMGVLAAYAWRDAGMRGWLAARPGGLRKAWLVLAIGMGAMACSGLGWPDPRIGIVGFSWIAAFFTCTLLLAVLHSGGVFQRCLRRPALKPVATVSYGLYLLQGPMAALVETPFRRYHFPAVSWSATGVHLLAMAATAVAAAFSWKFFESRMIRMGHRFTYRRD